MADALEQWVKNGLEQGYSPEDLARQLVETGYSPDEAQKAVRKAAPPSPSEQTAEKRQRELEELEKFKGCTFSIIRGEWDFSKFKGHPSGFEKAAVNVLIVLAPVFGALYALTQAAPALSPFSTLVLQLLVLSFVGFFANNWIAFQFNRLILGGRGDVNKYLVMHSHVLAANAFTFGTALLVGVLATIATSSTAAGIEGLIAAISASSTVMAFTLSTASFWSIMMSYWSFQEFFGFAKNKAALTTFVTPIIVAVVDAVILGSVGVTFTQVTDVIGML